MTLRSPSVSNVKQSRGAARKGGAPAERSASSGGRTGAKARTLLNTPVEEEASAPMTMPAKATATASAPTATKKARPAAEASRTRNEVPEAPPSSAVRHDEDEFTEETSEATVRGASESPSDPEEYLDADLAAMNAEPTT